MSLRRGERQWQHRVRAGRRSVRAANVNRHPVSVSASTSSTGPSTSCRSAAATTRPGPRPGTPSSPRKPGDDRVRREDSQVAQAAHLGQPCGQRTDQLRGVADSSAITALGRCAQSHSRSSCDAGVEYGVGDRRVRRVEQGAQPLPPAQVAEPAQHPARLGAVADLAGQRPPPARQAGGPLLTRARSSPGGRAGPASRPARPRRLDRDVRRYNCHIVRTARSGRVQGRRAGGAGTPSGTRSVVWYASIACCSARRAASRRS